MLHERSADEINHLIDDVLPALLRTLSDVADEVVLASLQVIVPYMVHRGVTEFMMR